MFIINFSLFFVKTTDLDVVSVDATVGAASLSTTGEASSQQSDLRRQWHDSLLWLLSLLLLPSAIAGCVASAWYGTHLLSFSKRTKTFRLLHQFLRLYIPGLLPRPPGGERLRFSLAMSGAVVLRGAGRGGTDAGS